MEGSMLTQLSGSAYIRIRALGKSISRRHASFLLLLATAVPMFAVPCLAAEPEGGPRQLLITYRCLPAARPAFRAYLQGEESLMLEKLKSEGVLKSYQILFNPFVTTGTWDAMTILSFSSYGATQRWKEIERKSPGGLSQLGLKLAKPIQTYSADLAWEGSANEPGAEVKRVFYVIPYSYNSLDQYKAYVDGYVIPQVRGWIKEGVLSRYAIYLNRYAVGDPWDALFVYEYRDLESFGQREETVAKVREPLRADPAWKHLNDIKTTIRSESENTIAEILEGHAR
jgi:DNA-binding Lrp family transcriptional regulator